MKKLLLFILFFSPVFIMAQKIDTVIMKDGSRFTCQVILVGDVQLEFYQILPNGLLSDKKSKVNNNKIDKVIYHVEPSGTTNNYAQNNFQWEKIDSVSKTRSQIYTDTKIFIAEKMPKANMLDTKSQQKSAIVDVIIGTNTSQTFNRSTPDRISQDIVFLNDDKDFGLIIIKGTVEQTMYFQLNSHIWFFSYLVEFHMKDNKYKININNVQCIKAWCANFEWPRIPCSDSYPGMKETSLMRRGIKS